MRPCSTDCGAFFKIFWSRNDGNENTAVICVIGYFLATRRDSERILEGSNVVDYWHHIGHQWLDVSQFFESQISPHESSIVADTVVRSVP